MNQFSIKSCCHIKVIVAVLLLFSQVSCQLIFRTAIGVHKPKIIEDRSISHAVLNNKIEHSAEGEFEVVYRKKDFVDVSGVSDFYDFGIMIYNKNGQLADLNETAKICDKSSFGYKSFKDDDVTLDRLIWDSDSLALHKLFSSLEKVDGGEISTEQFSSAEYYFVSFYSSYARGPQRRKSRLLRNALDFDKDAIVSIYINSDFIKSEFQVYSQQYEGFNSVSEKE